MWETGEKGRGDPFSGKEAATLSGKVRCNESALSESISLSSEENTQGHWDPTPNLDRA